MYSYVAIIALMKQMDLQHSSHTSTSSCAGRIAVVTMGVKLGDETRGYTRFLFLATLLAKEGFDTTLITTNFQHWNKAHRDISKECYSGYPFKLIFIDEPGYRTNIDLNRIKSHRVAAQNLRAFFHSAFDNNPHAFDLIYCEIPPNDVARAAAEIAHTYNIPFVADINDLWPEAMRMMINIPVVSDVVFYPFARDATRVYQLLDAAVGTSDEYAQRPARNRKTPYLHETVYVGNDLAAFDEGVQTHTASINKPHDQLWVSYAGTLGASYDIATLVEAIALANEHLRSNNIRIRGKILGDGPDRARFELIARDCNAPVDFLGYVHYPLMAAYLTASDIVVNSLVKGAAQSIVTKIGDYLASGCPLVNTGESPEFCAKVNSDGFGINVAPNNVNQLAETLVDLALHPKQCALMGTKARHIAEQEFDQRTSYHKIITLIRTLI